MIWNVISLSDICRGKYLFRPRPGESLQNHQYYRLLYPKIVHDISVSYRFFCIFVGFYLLELTSVFNIRDIYVKFMYMYRHVLPVIVSTYWIKCKLSLTVFQICVKFFVMCTQYRMSYRTCAYFSCCWNDVAAYCQCCYCIFLSLNGLQFLWIIVLL